MTKTFNTRQQKKTNSVWRRRRCATCGAAFTTLEHPDYVGSFAVQDRASHIVPFSRDLLFLSIYEACKHRPDATVSASALAATVIGNVVSRSKEGVLKRDEIVRETSLVLKRFDKSAWVSYNAFHPL